ncbi:double-strand break repair helicase AddA [Sphingomonas sp. LY160]|uniref:double-strand break repair helicase AddA n=1 Tax=Sphingomonas sp. LY160 TaxID=3095342 RepID=UPI002ADEEC04|nr:double-strand break repair helicase AddA [Sphingomonas sp. LY160]MEA1071237.1 double-strand break repair helicase AddA [Sphingomonas sp. LY160]
MKPFPPLKGAQDAASDPTIHAALSASAGTGKTQVLTARVIRLLLRGVPPEAILCLTFTKAGAAEMANRIAGRLAHWVRLPDPTLEKELFALGEERDKPALQRARRLFTRVLEARGGGLRIQTIHSFAQQLLASFPAEAGIAPGLKPIEGRAEQELARQTLALLLSEAEGSGRRGLLDDVSALSLRLGEEGAQSYLMDCAHAHEAMAALGAPSTIEQRLFGLIGMPGGADDFEAKLADDAIDRFLFNRLVLANRAWKTATGDKIVANLGRFVAASPLERAALLDGLGSNLVTAKGEICKVKPKQVAADPDYEQVVQQFADWWSELRLLRSAGALAKTQAAGLRAGQAFAAAYVRAKRAAGVADFDDLIHWTQALFQKPGMGDWVRYKLDQRTDHILVDEAQDTNQDQWAIVDALAGEYFTGDPEAEDRWRTLFMVGDYKQAIFGFQGTNPREYDKYRSLVAERASAAGEAAMDTDQAAREFRDLSIDASFRSSPAVLELVDAMIGDVGHSAMGLPNAPPPHVAFHSARPGRVELWPAFEPAVAPEEDTADEGWIDEPLRLYADAMAATIRRWLDAPPMMGSTGRPLTAGDILILVRSRTEFASLIVARLYAQGVPVAGIDRLHLHKPLAVKDLLSAIRFVVQPLDDLNLAGLLVSPLLGWDQQQLYDLAFDRSGRLWTALSSRRDEKPDFAEAHRRLSEWLTMADYVTPARFMETILSGPVQGRHKLLERLGEAARDPIEELVASAVQFEGEEIASLDRFLAWFDRGDVEVKRDASASGNAVRVMTVHAAKGLEAPLVILADATHDPAAVGGTSSTMEFGIPDVGNVPLIRPRKDECAPLFRLLLDETKKADEEEHWRLAYVGLTRAAERLVIAGVKKRRDVPEKSWHQASARAMLSLGAASEEVAPWGSALVWENAGRVGAKRSTEKTALIPLQVPDSLRTPAPIEARPPQPLSPSQIIDDMEAAPPPTPAMRAAAQRGTLLHTLFERLPAVDPDERHVLALRWLAKAGVAEEAMRVEIAEAACKVIADPAFADVFGPSSIGEAPLAATLPDGRVIAGTVDRLLIEDDRVQVIDFKTGRAVPSGPAEIPAQHRRQMEAYAAALAVIFPDRTIETALLYTSGPRLIPISA